MIVGEIPSLSTLINDVIDITIEAGRTILSYYETSLKVEYKNDLTPLTEADLAANAVIEERLKSLQPSMPIISEESKLPDYPVRSNWVYYWMIDPMDGTRSFVRRSGNFTVNIALMKTDSPVLGVVHWPIKNHTYWGYQGSNAYCRYHKGETRKIQVREFCGKNAQIICSGSRGRKRVNELVRKLERDSINCDIRTSSSSIKSCYIAAGEADIYPAFSVTHEWDTAAAQSVVESAGGRVTDLSGNVLKYNKSEKKLFNPQFLVMGGGEFDWVHYIQSI